MKEYTVTFYIKGEESSCLTKQFLLIIETLEIFLNGGYWLVGDIDGDLTGFSDRNQIKKLTTSQLRDILSVKGQIFWGTFIYTKDETINLEEINIRSEFYYHANLENYVVEIRAYDGTEFQVYSPNEQIIDDIKKHTIFEIK